MVILHRTKAAIAALLALLSGIALAGEPPDARPIIQWYVPNLPPIVIPQGSFQGQGWGDRRRQILTEQMPMFRHEVFESSGTRFIETLKSKPNVCSANLLRTPEREAYIEFSMPLSRILPNGFITTRMLYAQFKPYLNEHGELKLGDFLAHGIYRLAISAVSPTRSFGHGIDPLLKKYADSPSIVFVPTSNHGRLLKLTTQNEFDAIVGYAVELRYLIRELGLAERDFVFVPIAEAPPLIATFVGCSKTALGKQIIGVVNRLFADEQIRRADTAAYRFWLDDESATRYDRLLRDVRAGR